jgi:ABC-2 type transport system permease protein
LAGKIFRFGFFIAFLFFILEATDTLAGYTLYQTVFFFLTFNLIDITGQFLFREVYRFRPQLIKGTFDLSLVKPANALFRALMGGADILDFLTVPPLIFAIYYVGNILDPTSIQVFYYVLLLLNGLLLATAFHIAVISFGIITLEVDHTIMIYRDVSNLGKLPIDIYKEPLKGILTYLIPVGVMITLPAKALMGLVTLQGVLGSMILGVGAMYLSLRLWNSALRQYTSASS